MADPVSAAASVLALVTTGLQAASLLLKTIKDIKEAPRVIRDLREEVTGLALVLESLKSTTESTTADFSILDAPLRRCDKACQEFNNVLLSNFDTTGGKRKPILNWAKLKYLDSDIHGFKDAVSGYKSTIQIALGTANLQSLNISREAFADFKQMIADTITDLQARLNDVDTKLRLLASQTDGNDNTTGVRAMREERSSIKKCLQICDVALAQIHKLRESLPEYFSPSGSESGPFSEWVLAASNLANCKAKLVDRIRSLENIQTSDGNSRAGILHIEKEMREELECLEKSVAICKDASQEAERNRTNTFEDVSIGDDGFQSIVSTVGDLIHARGVKAGARATQVLGQLSEASFQHVASRERDSAEKEFSASTRFASLHGAGKQLQR